RSHPRIERRRGREKVAPQRDTPTPGDIMSEPGHVSATRGIRHDGQTTSPRPHGSLSLKLCSAHNRPARVNLCEPQFKESDAISKNNSQHLRNFEDLAIAGNALAMMYLEFIYRNRLLPASADEAPPKPFRHVYQKWKHSLEQFNVSQNKRTTGIV